VAGRGSAVFLHVARPNRSPTAGCVALAADNLQRLLAVLGPKTQIAIQYQG
jgi:L,D-peptidoglycan transpeptidase YkuD (ErfK/YbiS/YcfS/YnhG family)